MPPGMFQSVCYQRMSLLIKHTAHGVKVGVRAVGLEVRRPDNGRQAHLRSDASDSVVDVSVRRSECVGRHADGVPNDLLRPPKLSDNLLVGQGSEGSVRPGVDGDLVTACVLGLERLRSRQDSRANDEEGRLEVDLVQVVKQDGGVWRRSIIVRQTPGELVRALGDIGFPRFCQRGRGADQLNSLHPPQVHQHRPSVIAPGSVEQSPVVTP